MQMLTEPANLLHSPAIDEQHLAMAGHVLALGDLHGNALKLMYFLIRHGIAKLTDKQYQQLADIYYKDVTELSSNDIVKFKTIVSEVHYQSSAHICFIGDDLADRGSNDYFTLLIFQALHQAHVNFTILLSNHNTEFLKVYLSGLENNLIQTPASNIYYATTISIGDQDKSLQNLGYLLAQYLISFNEINSIVKQCYLPHLQLLYVLKESNKKLLLFTHAPTGLAVIKGLAQKYQLPYADQTMDDLIDTIAAINHAFQQQLQNQPEEAVYYRIKGDAYNICAMDEPLKCILWNRINVHSAEGYELQEMPHLHHGYEINYISGHNGNGVVYKPYRHYVFNLDNILGKTMAPHAQHGEYTFIYI
jgi:hypothetical protein